MNIFTLGAYLDFQGVEMPLTSLNSQSALVQPDVVQAKLEHALSQDRVTGPFHTPLLPNFKSSPLAIREKQAPGTYRLLHNLSLLLVLLIETLVEGLRPVIMLI